MKLLSLGVQFPVDRNYMFAKFWLRVYLLIRSFSNFHNAALCHLGESAPPIKLQAVRMSLFIKRVWLFKKSCRKFRNSTEGKVVAPRCTSLKDLNST